MIDKRAEGIRLLREWAREQAGLESEEEIIEAHNGLSTAMQALLEEFRTEFDVPGTRYFESYWPKGHRSHFSSCIPPFKPNYRPPNVNIVEVNRVEYLARQGIWRSYEEDRL